MGQQTVLLTAFVVGSILVGCVANHLVIQSPLNPVTVELPDCRSVFSGQEAKEQFSLCMCRESCLVWGQITHNWQVNECVTGALQECHLFLISLQLCYCLDLSFS